MSENNSHVDPDITAEFIFEKLKELDPALIIQHLRGGIHAEVLVAINNAEQIDVVNADGEATPGQSMPGSHIGLGEIRLTDVNGNTRVITPISDTIEPA